MATCARQLSAYLNKKVIKSHEPAAHAAYMPGLHATHITHAHMLTSHTSTPHAASLCHCASAPTVPVTTANAHKR